MSSSVWPHRRQPTRLLCSWDSPCKNTGVGCHSLLQCTKVKSESEIAQSCPTLSDPRDFSLPGSSVHGIFQARVLEWVAVAVALRLYCFNIYFHSGISLQAWLLSFPLTFFSPPHHIYLALPSSFLYISLWISLTVQDVELFHHAHGVLSSMQCWKSSQGYWKRETKSQRQVAQL